MLRQLRILAVAVIFFFSCKEEDAITPRNYPFIKTLDVHSIDETGASIDFEIAEKGNSVMNSFGVEYIESSRFEDIHNTLPPVQIEKTGTPPNTIETLRIDYDLVVGREYAVRPFVKTSSKIIYGEPALFDSRGVKGPEIREVSQSVIINSTEITITGDFFNSRIEDNSIEIPGFEDYFRIEIFAVSRNEIKFRLSRNYVPFPYNDGRKFSLHLKSGGKTAVLEDCFSLGFPSIESISPLSVYVGEEIRVKFNPNAYLINSELYFNYNIFPSLSYPIEKITEDELVLKIGNLPTGKYPISLRSYDFVYEYPEQLEILSSWDVYRTNTNLPSNLYDYHYFIVGDNMVIWGNDDGYFQETYLYNLKNDVLKKIAPKQNNNFYRGETVMTAAQNRYLYYGLGLAGNYNTPTNFKDFSRLDVTTGEWESLPDFPKESTRVLRSFEMQGKIYVVLSDFSNFFIFDPGNMTWTESNIDIPDELHWTTYKHLVIGNTIYYQTFQSIYSIKIGEAPVLIYDLEWNNQEPVMTAFENDLILTYGTYGIFKINLESKEVQPIQSLLPENYYVGIPWATSEGFLFVNLHQPYENIVNKNIYRLK
jgi:hypothetical protein